MVNCYVTIRLGSDFFELISNSKFTVSSANVLIQIMMIHTNYGAASSVKSPHISHHLSGRGLASGA